MGLGPMGMAMRKAITLAMLMVATAAPASAQGWSFGVEVGPKVYFGPPPVYYEPPLVYESPPAVYYEEAPVVIAPALRSRVLHMEAPEDVLDRLARRGYRDFSRIDRRSALYTLTALDPDGDLVSLEISIFTGRIERSSVLEARYVAAPKARRAPAQRTAPVAAPVKPAPLPKRKPTPAAAPAKPDAAAQPSGAEPAGAPPASGGDAPSSTLRDRLHTPPAAPADAEPDPLVVY